MSGGRSILGYEAGTYEAVSLDIARLVDTRLLVQANSGGGKSWALRRILEQTHGRVQHLVIDPEGEFASLRERFDYVLAAKVGGDTVADPRSAGLLAERLLELGVSAILDIYELKAPERVKFVRVFLETLVDAPKKLWHPALVVVDEAHIFCPEKEEAESAGAVKDLATRGRKRGFCAVLATQRLAKLAKDAAAECNNKLIGRTALDVDLKRAADALGRGKDSWPEFRDLQAGEFFAQGPALSRAVVRIKVGEVQTTHPKAGARLAFTPPPPTDKVRALLPKLADLPAEAEQRQRTVEDLRKEVATLRGQLRQAEKAAPAPPAPPPPVEVPVLPDEMVKRLEAIVAAMHALQVDLHQEAGHIKGALREGLAHVQAVARSTRGAGVAGHRTGAPAASRPAPVVHRAPAPARRTDAPALSGVEQRILDALAELEVLGVTRPERVQVAFLAGYTNLDSKGFKNAMGSMRVAELIDYPSPGTVALTAAGRDQANPPAEPRTPEEVQQRVLQLLGGVHARVLEPLIKAYPSAIDREAVAQAAGYTHLDSKGFKNAMGRLRSLGFIDYPSPGQVKAQPVLFLEGAA